MKKTLSLLVTVLSTSFLLHGQTNRLETTGEPTKTEAAIQKLEREWADAVKRRDTEKLDHLQADDYVFTGPGGELWTKARTLDTIKSGDLEIDSFELSDVKVRLYGDTAVVTFRVMWNGTFRGMDISGPQRMTDVWVKRAARWQCVASQSTRVMQP
jgi:ketosteroid isomerase-like protein